MCIKCCFENTRCFQVRAPSIIKNHFQCHNSLGGFLISFFNDSFFLLSSLFSFASLDILVGLRFLGFMRLLVTRCSILFWAMALFSSCERASLLLTTSWPSLFIFFSSLACISSFSSSVKKREFATCHSASTMVSTLFTFWPPLPPLRAVLKDISEEKSFTLQKY